MLLSNIVTLELRLYWPSKRRGLERMNFHGRSVRDSNSCHRRDRAACLTTTPTDQIRLLFMSEKFWDFNKVLFLWYDKNQKLYFTFEKECCCVNLYTLPNFSFIVLRCPRIFSYFLSDSRNFLKIVAVWFFTYTLFFLHSLISSSFIKITKKFEKFQFFWFFLIYLEQMSRIELPSPAWQAGTLTIVLHLLNAKDSGWTLTNT